MGFVTLLNAITILLVFVLWTGFTAYFLSKKKLRVYVLFFTVFYVYIVKVLDYTLFQFQSLVLLKFVMPQLMLKGQAAGKAINLIPLVTLTSNDIQTSLLNILLFMPFGFGLPFITNFRIKNVIVSGLLFSIGIECMQWITGYIGNISFRIADINDVMFNTLGTIIGYICFVGFVRVCQKIIQSRGISDNPILRYITTRPQMHSK
jgi:glycopeptide antibiotics resistance protein